MKRFSSGYRFDEIERIVMRFSLLFLAALGGCSASSGSQTVVPPPIARAYDPSIPEFEVIVEPVKFVAVIPHELYTWLCYMDDTDNPISNSPNLTIRDCGGSIKWVTVPKLGPIPEHKDGLYLGEQRHPYLTPDDLSSALTSELKSIGNIRVTDPREASRRGGSRYLVRAQITEATSSAEESERSFGGGPYWGILLGAQTATKVGFVRLDISLIDRTNGRYVDSFAVGGSASEEYIQSTFLGGIDASGKKYRLKRALIVAASRNALRSGAGKIFDSLQRRATPARPNAAASAPAGTQTAKMRGAAK